MGVDKVEVQNYANDTLALRTTLAVKNPNRFNINLNNLHLLLMYKGKTVGVGKTAPNILMKKKSKSLIKVQSYLSIKELAAVFPDIASTDSFPVTVFSEASFSFLKIPVKNEMNVYFHTGELFNKIGENVIGDNIMIKRVKILKSGLDSTRLDLVVTINNKAPFDYTIAKIETSVFSNPEKENLLGRVVNKTAVKVEKNTFIAVPVMVKLGNMAFAKTALLKLIHLNNAFYLEGCVDVTIGKKAFSFPFHQEIHISPSIF